MKKHIKTLIIVLLFYSPSLFSCTNLLVTKGASVDSATYLVYLNDGEWLYQLNQTDAKSHDINDSLIYTSMSGTKFKVHQVNYTNAIIGFQMNEYQLAIGETTFLGREELWDKNLPLKYWELMELALLRVKTAREAIEVITTLVEQYGYGSEGESFSIADPNEAWILEMIGTGGIGGAVWVARKVPDGMITAHANHARIGEFPMDDTENCIYSNNVISFAIEKGYYDPTLGIPFEFNNVYDPPSKEHIKYTESRVWSIFNRAAPSLKLSSDCNRGAVGAERYPLFIVPDQKLNLQDVFSLVRDHYEGTELDMTKGPEAGPFGNPNRVRPLSWKIDSVNYSWERAISTYNTAFSYVAQLRNYLPDEIGGIAWFGVDDTYTSCFFPIYCSVTQISLPFATGDINNYSRESAWWAFNFAANYANTRYGDIVVDIIKEQQELENLFVAQQDSIENIALSLDGNSRIEFLTRYSDAMGNIVHRRWVTLGDRLVTKYNDGYIKDNQNRIKTVGYQKEWLELIINHDADKYKIAN
ncbi:MAG: C69 family dipeptidase [Bacteroidetes bacterium]|nr:C69 family dipeptidase [Bacteroidota bacterium]